MISYTIVVAKYNENMSWINEFRNKSMFVVYDKGSTCINMPQNVKVIKRPNIGREVESFLYHIIENYENLPDYVIFVQGNPFDHMTIKNGRDLENAILNLNTQETIPLFAHAVNEPTNCLTPLLIDYYFKQLFDDNIPNNRTMFSAGCQYVIPKKSILSRSIDVYKNIHCMLLNTPVMTYEDSGNSSKVLPSPYDMCGWTFERLIGYLFGIYGTNMKIHPNLEKKRYLVTGGCGFIGSNLVKRLSIDCKVIVIDNLSTGKIENLEKEVRENENVFIIKDDICSMNIFNRVGFVDGIFHLAAMSKVLPSLENTDMVKYCAQQNEFGTINVLKYSADVYNHPKVVYSASSTYYGNNPIPNVETQSPDCQTPYALSKFCGEQYCKLFSKLYNVPTVRLRYFMVYGPNEPCEGSYAVVSGIFIHNFINNLPLKIEGTGEQTRDFVHVDDVVTANIMSMVNDSITDETINIGTGTMVSIKQLADAISSNQYHVNARKIDLMHTLSDTTKCEKLFDGWKPTKNIIDYITSILRN